MDLNDAHGDHDDFVLLSIGLCSRDTMDKQRTLAKKLEYDWPKVFDTHGYAQTIYDVQAVPTIVLVDPNGKVVKVGGFRDMDEVREILDGALE